MALRLYLYHARVLEKIIKGKNLYSGNCLSIPWPEFFVLYNGKESYPDKNILRLSDLFNKPQDLGLSEKDYPFLELEVKVININEGKNEEIANRCKKLAEYSIFIATARTFEDKLNSREEGIRAAIKYCSKHDILKKQSLFDKRNQEEFLLLRIKIDKTIQTHQKNSRVCVFFYRSSFNGGCAIYKFFKMDTCR
jgi:hypothetical protein